MVKTNKKVDKREAHIKKKLSAAVLMLLISCIMCVTSTYAWFTLSTAPEITGVSTTVGANGSLEIALASTETWESEDIDSNTGDGLLPLIEKNITWGNLVDLNTTEYGLDQIVLYPSRLNWVKTNDTIDYTKINSESGFLQTPQYGADGRVTTLSANTSTGVFDSISSSFVKNDDARGVRAIGTVSSMTDRELAYRNSLGNIKTNMTSAVNSIRSSWSQNASNLTLVAIRYMDQKDATVLTPAEKATLDLLVDDLDTALDYVDAGIINAMDAYLASAANEYEVTEEDGSKAVSDAPYLAIHQILPGLSVVDNIVVDGTKVTINNTDDSVLYEFVDSDAKFVNIITEYQTMATKVSTTASTLEYAETNTDGNYTWASISSAFNNLINPDHVELNGYTPSEFLALPEMTMAKLIFTDGLEVQLTNESGIYYDVAKFVGNIEGYVVIPKGSTIKGIDVTEDMNVKLMTKYPVSDTNPTILDGLYTFIKSAGAPSATGSAGLTVALTDTYGYVIDFFVRTNAANSELLLQGEAVNRVNSDAPSEATQGSGSNMTFVSNRTMLPETVKKLMEAIRVVFVDEDYTILTYARLDKASYNGDGTNHTMTLRICDEEGNIDSETTTSTPDDSSEPVTTTEYNNTICELNQNEPKKISVIVYLDGDIVDNSYVATDGYSLDGSMNLQFSSSAELKAMDYKGFESLNDTEE